ncbi:MAG: hypothetical protein ACI92O_000294 [Colwellia sp.]|jgi:hypothetical protein
MKHCLILPCSDKKHTVGGKAIDLYRGVLMNILHKCDMNLVQANFDILFLSAKHGLVACDTVIAPYDTKMPSQDSELLDYAYTHAKNANELLKRYAATNIKLFTVLSKTYQQAFDLMSLSCLKTFQVTYHSRNSRGIGEHRSRLKKIILSTLNEQALPTLFRSGCSNPCEMIAFIQANQSIGTSLAYLDKSNLRHYTINAIKQKQRVFVDNGLVTAVTRNEILNNAKIFQSYIELTSSIRGTKNLSIVVPDAPQCQDLALAIIREFRNEIRRLAVKCRVIIVFHKPNKRSVASQAMQVMEILGKVDITLGIPCRNKRNNQWRLSTEDIESLFSLTDTNKQPIFNKVHFLALSEKSRGKAYQERLTLSNMYNMEFSCDACRITAIFGNEKTSNRVGSIATREVKKQIIKNNVLNDPSFINYDAESEIDSSELWDEIKYFTANEKVALWNHCYPYIAIQEEIEADALEVFENLTSEYFHDFIIKAKFFLYYVFSMAKHEPKHDQKRTEAIIKCFNQGARQAIQQVMNL